MGYWGWRPLILSVFMSVWVVGCNIITDAAPAPSATPSPVVTLTIRRLSTIPPSQAATPTPQAAPLLYEVQPGDSWRAIGSRFGVDVDDLQAVNDLSLAASPQPGQLILIPPASDPALLLRPPVCYETPADSLLCLGGIENTYAYPVEQAAVVVQVRLRDGTLLTSEVTEIEQLVILPGATAPYRVLFDVSARDLLEATALLVRAHPARDVARRFVTLTVENERSQLADGRYVVTATVRNPGPDTARAVRVIVTLYDGEGSIIGYRVVRARSLLRPGGSLPIRVEILPQMNDITPAYTLYIEAQRAP